MEPDHTGHGPPLSNDCACDHRQREDPRLQLFLKRAPAIVWTTDRDLVFTSLQGAGLEALNIAPGQWVGVRMDDHVRLHEVRDVALDLHRRALAGESLTLEGHWAGRHYEGWLEPLYDGQGAISGCTGLVLDNAARVRAQDDLRAARDELVQHVQEQTETLSSSRKEPHVYGEELREQQEELRRQNEELAVLNRALEAERWRYQVLFDFAPDGYLVTNLEGVILQTNRAASRLLHARQDFMVGKLLAVYVTEEENPAFFRALARLRNGEVSEIHDWRTRFLPRGGSPFEAALTVSVAYDVEGERSGLRWMVRDVSERVRMEERLRFQAHALDQVGDAVIAIDERERIVYLNRSAADLYDVDLQEALGSPLEQVYRYEWLAPEHERAATSALASQGQWRGENVHWRRDGRSIRVESTVSVLRDEKGVNQGLLAAMRDVTERRQLQEERERLLVQSYRDREALEALAGDLKRERDLLRTVMENTHAQLAYLDADFNFVRVNAAYCRGSGYSAQALIGCNHFALFPDEGNLAIFERVRDSGEPVHFQAKPFEYPDRPELGTTYWDWTLVPVREDGDAVRGLVFSLLDVTERERARREREAHLRRLDALIEISQEVLAETSVEGVLQRVVDAARELTGARIGVSGHGYTDGVFWVGTVSRAQDAPPCSPGEVFAGERGGVYMDLIETAPSVRLTDDGMRAHPAWWGLPEGHSPLRGLLGARLTGRDGRAQGLIIVSDKADPAEREFTAEDEALLAQLAALASLALGHIEAHDEAERRAGELEAVFTAMVDGVLVLNQTGAVVRANAAAAETLGLDPVGVDRTELGRAICFRHLDGRPATVAEFPSTQALLGKMVGGERFLFTDPAGKERALVVSGAPLAIKAKTTGAVLVWHDITELESARQERERLLDENRRQRDFLERLMEESPVGIAVVSGSDHRYTYVNPYYRAIPGMPGASMVGRTIAEVFPAVAAQGALSMVEEARRTGQVVSVREYETSVGPGRERTYWNVDHVPLGKGNLSPEENGQDGEVLILASEVTTQVLARKELESERARLRAIIDNAPEGIVVADRQGQITLTNPAADRLYARSVPHRQGHASRAEFALCRPDGTPYESRDLPLTRSALDGEAVQNLEMSILWPDGERRHLLVHSAPIYASEGALGGAVGLFQDVTDLRRMDAALRESRERLRLALSAARMGTWRWDLATDLDTRDAELNKLYGLEGVESAGPVAEFAQRVHPDDLSAVRAEARRALRERDVYQAEYRVVRPDGEVRWVRATGRAFYDLGGQPTHMTGIVADITDWTQAQADIAQLRRRNELILSSAGEGILGLDREGRITFANPAVTEMVGWAVEDLIGALCHEVIHRSRADGTPYPWQECLVQATIEDGAIYTVSDELFWRKDGTGFPAEYTSTPIVEDGEIDGAVLVFRDISEQKQAQQAIVDLARFPSENPNPVLRVSYEGVILYANQGSEPLLAAWEAGLGQRLPGDWWQRLLGGIAKGSSSTIEVSAGERTFALTIAPLVEYVNLYGLDITARKRIEEALYRSAERLHILHETDRAILSARTPEELATVALSHVRQLVPFAWASVTLFDTRAAQMSLLALYVQGEIELDRKWRHPLSEIPFLAQLGQGQVYLAEDVDDLSLPPPMVQMLRAQGVRAYATVPLIAQETLIGSLNLGMAAPGAPSEEEIEIAREIANELAIGIRQSRLLTQVQRHAVELEHLVRRRTAALQASQARFQAVFEDSALGIALVDRRGRVIDSNPALQEMLGYSKDELEGLVFSRLAHLDNVRNDADLYDELMAGERSFYRIEGRYLRKDGQPIHANLTVSLVRPARGRSRFAIALVEDVTEQKRAQKALVEAEKLALTGRLAASLAHEINNPMQSVIGYLSLVEETLPDQAHAHEYVEIALEELERAASIVARMRDLSRPSDVGEREPVDVNDLLERVLLLTQKQCQNHRIEVQWKAAEDLPLLELAPDQMRQVFLNLVLNAVDAMAADDRLDERRLRICTIRTQETPGVQIVFADNGVGIPSGERRDLFEPFHTTKELGVGLGLYISQSIVQDHGGTIEVESQEEVGTTFTVWLPSAILHN